MQMDQRGAKEECSGTLENLLIDDMVLKDAPDNKRNLSCCWIDVKKAYDSLSHSWLIKMLEIHRFPVKFIKAVEEIVKNWNTVLIVPLTSVFDCLRILTTIPSNVSDDRGPSAENKNK